jgi:hypothetical protein
MEGVTRDGRAVLIIAITSGKYCIKGTIGLIPMAWSRDGKYCEGYSHGEALDLFNKPSCAHEEKEAKAGKMKDYPNMEAKMEDLSNTCFKNHSAKPATEPSSSCETFGWKEAAKLWAEGVEIEMFDEGQWYPLCVAAYSLSSSRIYFKEDAKYRLKPLPPQEHSIKMWVNVYGEKSIGSWLYNSKTEADSAQYQGRFACVPVMIKFHKGQGLSLNQPQ